MTDFSVPLAVPDKAHDDDRSRITLPVIAGLSMISIGVVLTLILWVMLVSDPMGGQPQVSVFIEDKGVTIDPGLVAVGGVRPSITPDPNEVDELATTPAIDLSNPASTSQIAAQNAAPEVQNTFEGVSSIESTRLSVFPLDTLVERSEQGLIPKRGGSGQTPFSAYSRPPGFIPDGPKIALIIGGVGLSERNSEEAIKALPTIAALALSPYGRAIDKWNKYARENGFELLVQAPMEPFNYPQNDPGPHTLLVDGTLAENTSRLEWLMSRLTNYIGIIPAMGARFTSDEEALKLLLATLNERGLAFVDPATSVRSVAKRIAERVSSDELGRLPFLKVDIVLDSQPDRVSVEQHLAQLEELSRSKGLAVGYADLRSATIDIIAEWAAVTERRGITLVPLSTAIALSEPAS